MIEAVRRLFARVTPAQRKVGLGGALLLVLGAALLLAMTSGGEGGSGGSVTQSPSTVFASRSPGKRFNGALYQIKEKLAAIYHARLAPDKPRPTQRVLSAVRVRPAGPLMLAPDTGPYATSGLLKPLDTVMPPVDSLASPAFEVPGFSFGDVPVAPNGGPDQPIGPPPGPAVPETSTWLMMIAGIAFVGAALRRHTQHVIA